MIEHRRWGFVAKQAIAGFDDFHKAVIDRLQFISGRADPVGKGRAIEMNAFPGEDLGKPVERQKVGELRDHDMGDEAFGRQPALDEMGFGRRLDRRLLATPAAIFRAARADHAEARRLIFETLGDVLADFVQGAAARRTGFVVGLQHPVLARQLRRWGRARRIQAEAGREVASARYRAPLL